MASGGTTTSPKLRPSEKRTYGSRSGRPSTSTVPRSTRTRSPGRPMTRLMKTVAVAPSRRKATMSPRFGRAIRYAKVLMSTYSPEAMWGAMESPETCGVRMKNAAAKTARTASCNAKFASERQGNARVTELLLRRYKIRACDGGQKMMKARPVNPRVRPCADRRRTSFVLREAPDVRVLGVVPIVAEHQVTVRRNAVRCFPHCLGRNVCLSGVSGTIRCPPAVTHVNAVVRDLEVVVRRLLVYVSLSGTSLM